MNPNDLREGDEVKYTAAALTRPHLAGDLAFNQARRGVVLAPENGWCNVKWEQPTDNMGLPFYHTMEELNSLELVQPRKKAEEAGQ